MSSRCLFLSIRLLWLAVPTLGWCAQPVDIVAYTEESAPYHYTENGKIVGTAADRLRAACALAQLNCSLTSLPWARAMALARQQADSLLFSIVRSPDRERDFIWLSPIATEEVWIFGRPGAPVVGSVGDLARGRIGIINGSSGAAFLTQAGVPRSAMDFANSTEANMRKFAAHRVDFILSTEGRLAKEVRRFQIPFQAQKVLRMQDATSYYAMHPQSTPWRVAALRGALQELAARDQSK
ncbi:MAG: substrate-binding periplasmic protein [Sphingomonadaceae bacterium]